jgi:hypothetical protein
MKFTATDDQIAQLMANAVNAARPMGLGYLHFKPEDKPASEFGKAVTARQCCIDYYQGRMTKLYLDHVEGNTWKLPDGNPRSDYQSWNWKYPTYQALVESVGAKVV